MTKNLVPILAVLLVTMVTGAVLLLTSIATKEGLPASNQKQIQELNPELDTSVLNQLKALPAD